MTSAAAGKPGLTRAEWRVLALLVLSILINYIERGNLSVAAPALKGELGLSEYELGKLLAAFFWTYAGFQLVAVTGWVVDRFHIGWGLGIAYFLWTGATALTGVAAGFASIFLLRMVLGAAESVAYPAYSKILAGGFPEHHRGLANALIDFGSKAGPAIGTLGGGLLIARFGWRAYFIGLGLAGMLWLLPWAVWMPRDRAAQVAQALDAPSILDVLHQRRAWGTFAGLFCANYYWYFLLTWLPFYLVRERKYSMDRMATFGAMAYLAIGISAIAGGWLSDRWIAAGATPTRARKTFLVSGLLLSTIIIPVGIVHNETAAMALLMTACFVFGLWSSNHWAVSQTLAGPKAAGKWTGLQNGVGNLAGVVSPWLTGAVITWTGSFLMAFVVASAMAVAGACMYLFAIGPVEPVRWRPVPAAAPRRTL
jgi:MFS transporter, ACS family, D-galactonate transporter